MAVESVRSFTDWHLIAQPMASPWILYWRIVTGSAFGLAFIYLHMIWFLWHFIPHFLYSKYHYAITITDMYLTRDHTYVKRLGNFKSEVYFLTLGAWIINIFDFIDTFAEKFELRAIYYWLDRNFYAKRCALSTCIYGVSFMMISFIVLELEPIMYLDDTTPLLIFWHPVTL